MTKSKPSDEFRHESLQDRDSIVSYLEAVGHGLSSGKIYFASGDSELLLRPEGMLRFLVQAKRKGEVVKLTVKISWREDQTAADPPGAPLLIRSAQQSEDEGEDDA
jgi:amphi-Trp domain-containing protein